MRKLTFSLALLAALATSVSPAVAETPTGYAYGDLTGVYPWPSLAADGVTAGTYTKVTVDAKGRATVGATANLSTDVTGYLPVNSSTVGLLPYVGAVHQVRGVVTVNETTSAFDSVSGGTVRDGVTYVAGDRVLLVGQSTKSQNGIWVVGTVATGTAPLTRPLDFASGAVLTYGHKFEVSEGTVFANSTWKITTAGPITVDTTLFDAYPREVIQQVHLASSTFAITNVPILSATQSSVVCSIGTLAGSQSSTVGYGVIGAITAGSASGSPSATVDAYNSSFAKNGTGDTSFLNCTTINW